jgi:CBS domain-containing protein
MNVANVLATKGHRVVTVRPTHSVTGAVTLLAEKSLGALVVVDDEGRPIGIVTERHVVRRLAADRDALARTVGDIMTRDVVVTTPEDELTSVLRVMTDRRIRHLPVVDRAGLTGIVSLGDVLRFQRDRYRGEAETLETRVMGA